MKKIYSVCLILLFALIILAVSSCEKSDENKIKGTWNKVNVANVNSTYHEYWVFNEDGGPLYIHMDANPNQGNPEINDTLRYYIKAEFINRMFVHIENSKRIPYYNGDWQIVHLTKSTMMIVLASSNVVAHDGGAVTGQGGLLFREFTKQ